MFGFLFGWLGSMGFWFLYFTITLFMGTLVLRHNAPKTHLFLTSKKTIEWTDPNHIFLGDAIPIIILNYLFWPFILIWLMFSFVLKLVFGKIVGPTLKRAIQFADSAMPKIEIKKAD